MDDDNNNNNNNSNNNDPTDINDIPLAGLTFRSSTNYVHVILLQLYMNQSFRRFLLEELVLPAVDDDDDDDADAVSNDDTNNSVVDDDEIAAVLELQKLFRQLQLHEFLKTLTDADVQGFQPAIRECFPLIRSMLMGDTTMSYDATKFIEAYDKVLVGNVHNPTLSFKSIGLFPHLFQLITRVATKYGQEGSDKLLKDILHVDTGEYRICKICRKDKVFYPKASYPYHAIFSNGAGNLEEDLLRQVTEKKSDFSFSSACNGDCQRRHRSWLSKTYFEKLPELLVFCVDRHNTKPNKWCLARVDTPFALPESLDMSPFLEEDTLREYQNVGLTYQWMGAIVVKETRGDNAELCYMRERSPNDGGWLQVQGDHFVRVEFARVQEVCFAAGSWEVIAFYERVCCPTENEDTDGRGANTGPIAACAGADAGGPDAGPMAAGTTAARAGVADHRLSRRGSD